MVRAHLCCAECQSALPFLIWVTSVRPPSSKRALDVKLEVKGGAALATLTSQCRRGSGWYLSGKALVSSVGLSIHCLTIVGWVICYEVKLHAIRNSFLCPFQTSRSLKLKSMMNFIEWRTYQITLTRNAFSTWPVAMSDSLAFINCSNVCFEDFGMFLQRSKFESCGGNCMEQSAPWRSFWVYNSAFLFIASVFSWALGVHTKSFPSTFVFSDSIILIQIFQERSKQVIFFPTFFPARIALNHNPSKLSALPNTGNLLKSRFPLKDSRAPSLMPQLLFSRKCWRSIRFHYSCFPRLNVIF